MTGDKIEIRPGVREGAAPARRSASGWSYRPRVDVVESSDDVTICVDMPGTTADDICIDFHDQTLSIHGEVGERQHRHAEYVTSEYGVGDFDREFLLSDKVDPERIGADFSRGVLTVRLPKTEAAKPRRIPVRSE